MVRMGTVTPVRAPVERPVASWFWALAPLYTLGLGTPMVMVHAAAKKLSLLQALAATVYVTALVSMFVVDRDAGGLQRTLFDVGMAVNLIVGAAHALAVRRWVFSGDPAHDARPSGLAHQQALALAQHQDYTAARAEAHRIVATDPALARGLVIGRPDLPGRQFPDGGVVDVNQATVGMLVRYAALPEDVARRIVGARDQVGELASYDDLLVTADVDHHVTDRVRDWLVFIPRAAGAPSSRGSRPR